MKIIAIDYGLARIGLAVSDVTEFLASPIQHVKTSPTAAEEVAAAVKSCGAQLIVCGLPLRTDGGESDMAEKAKAFAEQVSQLTGVSVVLRDERFTTVIAARNMRERGKKAKDQRRFIDSEAACVLLQDFLDSRR